MHRILVICPHPEDIAPGQRLKYEQYFPSWRQAGFQVDVRPFFSRRMQRILYGKSNTAEKVFWVIAAYIKRLALIPLLPRYDAVYVFLWITPFGPPVMERFYSWVNPKMIYDIDDAIFMKEKSVSNSKVDFLRGRSKPFFLMKHARHVLTGTSFLAEVAESYNRNVSNIPVTINTDRYQPVNDYNNDHRLVLGWSGSHSTSQFLYLIKDALIEVYRQIPFLLVVIGDENFNIPEIEIEALPWSADKEVSTLQRFDIGLYPLPVDNKWVLGKSGGKALQYMAVGIPVVATAAGANYNIIANGVNGVLVNSHAEWVNALLELLRNPLLRKKIGINARNTIVNNYSVNSRSGEYLNILQRVCSVNT